MNRFPPIKPSIKLLSQTQIAAGLRDLGPCRCLRVQELSGTVRASFDGGEQILLEENDVYELPLGLQFKNVRVFGAAGATGTILHGMVSFGGGVPVAQPGTVQATVGDPEGVLDAANGQWAYDGAAGSLYVNPNTSGLAGWVQLIA